MNARNLENERLEMAHAIESQEHRNAAKVDGQPVTKGGQGSEAASALGRAAASEPWKGPGLTFGPCEDPPSAENAGEANPAAGRFLDADTLRFCAQFLKARADEAGTGKLAPVDVTLRRAAGDMLFAAFSEESA